jgi:hypothetical protein
VDQADRDDSEQPDDEHHREQQERPGRIAQPRRLSTVMTARRARQSGTVAGIRRGKAEVSAAVPAAMETATVSV